MSLDPSGLYSSSRRFLKFLRDRPGRRAAVADVLRDFVDGTVPFLLEWKGEASKKKSLAGVVAREKECLSRTGLSETTFDTLTSLGFVETEGGYRLTPEGRRFIDLPVDVADGLTEAVLLILEWSAQRGFNSRDTNFLAGLTGLEEARMEEVAKGLRTKGLVRAGLTNVVETKLTGAGHDWLDGKVGLGTMRGQPRPIGTGPFDRSLSELQNLAVLLDAQGQNNLSEALLALSRTAATAAELADDARRKTLELLVELAKLAALEGRAPDGEVRLALQNLEDALTRHSPLAHEWRRWKDRLTHAFGV